MVTIMPRHCCDDIYRIFQGNKKQTQPKQKICVNNMRFSKLTVGK